MLRGSLLILAHRFVTPRSLKNTVYYDALVLAQIGLSMYGCVFVCVCERSDGSQKQEQMDPTPITPH